MRRARRTDPAQLALPLGAETVEAELVRIASDARRATAELFADFRYMLPFTSADFR